MANEKVSQMTSLTAAGLAPDDLLLITDISAKESKKMTAADFLIYIESTGSFFASNATLSDTTSYILGSGVDGMVKSSSYSINSTTSSFSLKSNLSDTSSYTKTASYAISSNNSSTTADTSSFLLYSGFPNGTSSFALSSNTSNVSNTSTNLLYIPGTTFNTASYALSSSTSNTSISSNTASYSNSSSNSTNSITSSYSLTAATASNLFGFTDHIKAWCNVSWSVGAAYTQQIASFNLKPQIGDGVENNGGIKYLGFNPYTPAPSTDYTIFFGISFQNPLLSNKYSFLGSGNTYMDPIIAKPTIYGFTMSISPVPNAYPFFNTLPSSRDANFPLGFTSFTIFG
jgi:hypothetical protein